MLIAAVVGALLLAMSTFTVRETELAIKFRFGEIVRADYKPGLHFMVPMVNNDPQVRAAHRSRATTPPSSS